MNDYECVACRNETHDDCFGVNVVTRDECQCMLHGHPDHDTEGELL